MLQGAGGDARWGWRTNQWRWSPFAGRWSTSYGLPEAPVYFEISADAVPPRSRYEYWRTLAYYSFDSDPMPPDRTRAFNARAQCFVGGPAQLFRYQSAAVSGRGIPADRSDDRETYLIGLVLHGQRHYAEDRGGGITSNAGQFFVFDNRGYSRVCFSEHDAVHISLPRSDVAKALGGRIPEPQDVCRILERSRPGALLKSQLQLAAAHLAAANEIERAFFLDQVTETAFFACEQMAPHLTGLQRTGKRDLYAAALNLIERELADPALNVSRLLDRLGCSRATLYRAFGEAEQGVSDLIAEMRIERAKAMLARSPHLPINLVAARCGWEDSASFTRVFRRREGASPSEFRQNLPERHGQNLV